MLEAELNVVVSFKFSVADSTIELASPVSLTCVTVHMVVSSTAGFDSSSVGESPPAKVVVDVRSGAAAVVVMNSE